ncbi:MAG: TM1266 family iron-only hydrogenase system putative regulator [Bacteroidales bacterium]
MEKRIGSVLVIVKESNNTAKINEILSAHGQIIIGRQGIPLRDRGISVISIVLEGNTDEIGSLTGKLGRLKGVKVKSVLIKNNFDDENK